MAEPRRRRPSGGHSTKTTLDQATDQLCLLLDPNAAEDARKLFADAFRRLTPSVDRVAVVHVLHKARWQANILRGVGSVELRLRQSLSKEARRIPVWRRQAIHGLIRAVAFHLRFESGDGPRLKAYREAADLLVSDPLLRADREARQRRAGIIASIRLGYLGKEKDWHPPSGPKGGRPAAFSLRSVRSELRALGVRGERQTDLLEAVGLLNEGKTSPKQI